MEAEAYSAEVEAIKRITEAWDAGWRDGDAEALASLFTQDAILMPQGQPEVAGRDAIQRIYQSVFEGYKITGGGEVLEIEVAGQWAFFRSTYALEAIPRGGGPPASDRGKWLCILKRQGGGAWRIARLIVNSDLPAGDG